MFWHLTRDSIFMSLPFTYSFWRVMPDNPLKSAILGYNTELSVQLQISTKIDLSLWCDHGSREKTTLHYFCFSIFRVVCTLCEVQMQLTCAQRKYLKNRLCLLILNIELYNTFKKVPYSPIFSPIFFANSNLKIALAL